MSFLTPFAAFLAAAITVPLLLLLYFLKLRRRYVRMASTLLWRSAFEDLEVNAPFRRLRFSTLLILQLLLLLALLIAMARPVTGGESGASERLILLIDRSASMNTVEADGRTRLEIAKEQAVETVERLRRSGAVSQVMVIAFARTAHVVSSFEFDRTVLVQAIQSIEPTHEAANLSAALQLAAGFAGDTEDIGAQEGEVVLFSDGVVAPPDDSLGYRLRNGVFRYVQIGPDPQSDEIRNLGIASFSARRDYDDPARVLVFARLVNAATRPVETVVTLRANEESVDMRRVEVPAATGDAPGEASITFSVELHDQAVLSLRHNYRDALEADDIAWLVVPAPMQPRVALVHAGARPDVFIYGLLTDMRPRELRAMPIEAFDQINTAALDTGELYDLVVFDRISPSRLPGIPTLTFGGVPRGVDVTEPRSEGGRRVLSWDRQHPVMRHVSLDTIVYAGFGGYELPPAATALATGPEGPVIALLRTRGARHVVVGFDLNRSNWPLHVSIVVFLQNVLDYITLAGSGQAGLVHAPGEPITVRAQPGTSQLAIRGPVQLNINVQGGAERTLPTLRQVGMYEVAGAAAPMQQIAVSMLSDIESDIRPRSELLVNAQSATGERGTRAVPRELWPWLVAVAMVLLAMEWMVYLRKARV